MLWKYVHSKGLCPSTEDLPGVCGSDLHVSLYIAKMCLIFNFSIWCGRSCGHETGSVERAQRPSCSWV